MLPPERIPRDFFNQPTLDVAQDILGDRLVRIEKDRSRTSGWIVEAEAYVGTEDQGCHARSGRTQRNQSMWGPPGHAYVYFTYGMHWMLNIVTEQEGLPAAVLLRALHPLENVARMRERRTGRPDKQLTDGPAKLCQALKIDKSFDGHDLCLPTSSLFLEHGASLNERFVTNGPRVGLNNVPQPWKSVPWRFRISPEGIGKLTMEEQG
jgi:DNA-3-methyladenine glycosylase